jgi:hypothetical protein
MQKRIEMKQWQISRQATPKEAEASTTTRSSLNLSGMAKLARAGRFFFLELFVPIVKEKNKI